MKIAITGGTGFVGGHLARRLIADGHEVVHISRNAGAEDALGRKSGVTRVPSDLSDASVLAAAFAG